MDETSKVAQDNRSSGDKGGITSTETLETYTKKEYLKGISDALAEQGRKHKAELDPIVKERDTIKAQLQTNTSELEDNKAEIEKLQAKIDALASDDPEKFNAVKELKEAREERKQLKTKEKELEGKESELAESKNELAIWKRDQLVYQVADEFITSDGKDIDFDSFKGNADKFKLNEREGLIALAETMGLKLKTEIPKTEVPPLKSYFGITEGGKGELTEQEKLDARYPTMKKK